MERIKIILTGGKRRDPSRHLFKEQRRSRGYGGVVAPIKQGDNWQHQDNGVLLSGK